MLLQCECQDVQTTSWGTEPTHSVPADDQVFEVPAGSQVPLGSQEPVGSQVPLGSELNAALVSPSGVQAAEQPAHTGLKRKRSQTPSEPRTVNNLTLTGWLGSALRLSSSLVWLYWPHVTTQQQQLNIQ